MHLFAAPASVLDATCPCPVAARPGPGRHPIAALLLPAIRSIRRWAYQTFNDERKISVSLVHNQRHSSI
jgi:hypothetical protein